MNFLEQMMFGNEPQNQKIKRKVFKWNEETQKYEELK